MELSNTELTLILNSLQEQAESTDFGFLADDHKSLRNKIENHLQGVDDPDIDSLRADIESQYSNK